MRPGWEVKRLGEVCRVVGGGTPAKDRADYYGGDIPWATVRDMNQPVIASTEHTLTLAGVRASATNIIPAGSVVVASRVGLGKVCWLDRDTAINQDLRAIIPRNSNVLWPQYLLWLMRYLAPQFVAAGRGATVQGVTLPFINGLELPLPPLAEQRRIVEVLDEAFAGLTTATANAEQTLAAARELFESERAAMLSRRPGGVVRMLGGMVSILAGFAFKSGQYCADTDGVRLLRGDNIGLGQLRWDGVKLWPLKLANAYERYSLASGDMVLAMDRTWIKGGIKFASVGDDDLPALLVQRVARLRPTQGNHAEFIRHLIASQQFTTYVLSVQTGLGVPHISTDQIAAFPVPAFAPSDQQRVAATLDDLDQHCGRLAVNARQKLTLLAELKQSLLARAFSGDLA